MRWPFPLARPAVAVTLLALLSVPAAAQGRGAGRVTRERVDTTFAFDRHGTVTVENTEEAIVVTGWDQDRVRVQSSGGISLDASRSRLTVAPLRTRGGDTHIEIMVPRGVRVVATSQVGDVTIRGTNGEVEVHDQSGDVALDQVGRTEVDGLSGEVSITTTTGDVHVQTVSGAIALTDAHGRIDLGSVSGDLNIKRAVSRSVSAKTTNGDVKYDGSIDPTGVYEFSSHSGEVKLLLPKDVGAQLTASTWSGSIDSDFPVTLRPGEHGIGTTSTKHFTFQIGKGGGRITAESFSGDITISSRSTGR